MIGWRNALSNLFRIRCWFVQISQIGFEVLHRRFNNAAFACDRLIAEVVESKSHAIEGCFSCDNSGLQVVEQVKVLLLKDICACLVRIEWSDPASVDTIKSTKLFVEVCLFNVSARSGWDPKFLRVSLKGIMRTYSSLRVDEAAETHDSENGSKKDSDEGTFCGPQAIAIKSLRDVTHANIISKLM